jgi:hypothetical protein
MKKIIDFFNRAFEELDYAYYNQLYLYDCKLYLGYVVVKNHRFLWIPMNRRVAVCCDKEELDKTLNLLKEIRL